ncbi:hypothetical protein BT93_F2577 [Corymbia citriodora subsp. variegata]|nr:hypothetical protein BT93_F2577 [Corymbia citriodora subsp. variegata]
MSQEESLKIQTWVLKVNINCDGCKQQVTKTLQKIDGVLTVKIDRDQNKVTVSGTAAPALLIKKLEGMGKPAELLGAQESNNSNPAIQFRDIPIEGGNGGIEDQKDSCVGG